MPASRIATRLTELISQFRHDRRANIAVIFALALLPVISAIGCATDYSLASRMKAKMQSAADAAAVASISEKFDRLSCGDEDDVGRPGDHRSKRRRQHLHRQCADDGLQRLYP